MMCTDIVEVLVLIPRKHLNFFFESSKGASVRTFVKLASAELSAHRDKPEVRCHVTEILKTVLDKLDRHAHVPAFHPTNFQRVLGDMLFLTWLCPLEPRAGPLHISILSMIIKGITKVPQNFSYRLVQQLAHIANRSSGTIDGSGGGSLDWAA